MKFKREHMRNEFWKLHVKLQYIVFDLALFVKRNFAKEIVVTSVYRPYNGIKYSVHNSFRGVDIRSKNFTKEERDAILQYISGRYQYDPKRLYLQTIIFHDVGQGEHFHLQVHPNTKVKFPEGVT